MDEAGEEHSLEAYDIGCDEGAWDHFMRRFWCMAQAYPFSFGKLAVGLGIQVMGWALEFQLADSLTPVAGQLSLIYDASLIGPLGLRHFAWTLALFVGGWHLMRARAARGIGEVGTTVLIAAVGAIVLANPEGYLGGAVALAQNTSGAVLEAIDETLQAGDSDDDAEAVRARLGDILRTSFVAEPYDLINWGEQLEGDCAAARDELLEGGPWGSDDEPRDIMREHGCDAQADFNADSSDNRAAASAVVAVAAVVASVLLVAVALVVIVAQLTLVALFAGASLVWTLALFPGARGLLWWWIGRLAWAVAGTVTATFVLSWLAVTVTALLATSSDISIIQRSFLVLLVVAFGFRLRGHLSRLVDQASRRFGDRLSRLGGQTPDGSPGMSGGGSGGGGGPGGVVPGGGLTTSARSWLFDFPGGQYVYNRLYARHFTRGMRSRGGGPIRRTLRRVGAADRYVYGRGTAAMRGAGRVGRAVALAPVLGPQAYARTRMRATAASQRARARLRQARGTGQLWVRNSRHPVQAMRGARREASPTTRRGTVTPSTVPARRHAAASRTTRLTSGATRSDSATPSPSPSKRVIPAARATGGTSAPGAAAPSSAQPGTAAGKEQASVRTGRARAQLQQARAARQQRARDGGHLIRRGLDARREAKEPLPRKNPAPPDDRRRRGDKSP